MENRIEEKKMAIGKKVKIKEEDKELLEGFSERISSIVTAIETLSVSLEERKRDFWSIVDRLYPELSGYEKYYNKKKQEIIILEKERINDE